MSRTEARAPASAWLPVALALLAVACARAPETGPGLVRWDRDICARCSMVISERHHAAQVRGGPADGRSGLFLFDDFGCAVTWLEGRDWAESPEVEIWVADHLDGNWLDARTASYDQGVRTPMDYGLGARAEEGEGSISFAEACAHVRRVEERQLQRRTVRPATGEVGQ